MCSFRSLISVVALGAGCGGCSFTLVTPPPARPTGGEPRPHVDCTTSRVAPIIDSVVTGYEAFRVGYAAWGPQSAYRRSPLTREQDMALGAAFGGVFLASAVYGFVQTQRCERMKDGGPPPSYLPGVSAVPAGARFARSRRADP